MGFGGGRGFSSYANFKLKHWRGLQRHFCLHAARLLEFKGHIGRVKLRLSLIHLPVLNRLGDMRSRDFGAASQIRDGSGEL